MSVAAIAKERSHGLSDGEACVQLAPSHVQVSLKAVAVPLKLHPPNIMTFPADGSYANVVAPRPVGPPRTAMWRAPPVASNGPLSSMPFLPLFCPNTTPQPVGGAYTPGAANPPPLGPVGGGTAAPEFPPH